jgi:hypothetical protein
MLGLEKQEKIALKVINDFSENLIALRKAEIESENEFNSDRRSLLGR